MSILTLLGFTHGLFLASALFNAKNRNARPNRALGLLTLLFTIDLGEEFLYQIGFFNTVPHLLQTLTPIDLLYGPLLYFYITLLVSYDMENRRFSSWHFMPVFTGIVLILPFHIFLGGAEKIAFVDALRKGQLHTVPNIPLSVEVGIIILTLITIAQIGFYLTISIRRITSHYSAIKQQYSDIEKISLTWFRNLLLGLSLIYLFFLGDQFFPDLWRINFLGDAITILAVILIYILGYLALRQPEIFTETLAGKTDQDSERYEKSGLDKEASLLLLTELRTHMDENKPYLDGGLTLPSLARQLELSTNYLSQIINEQLDMNFHDFINKYRVEEAQRLIQSSQQEINILQIAFESGFNSKSAFYSSFRKFSEMTPTQYSKNISKGLQNQ